MKCKADYRFIVISLILIFGHMTLIKIILYPNNNIISSVGEAGYMDLSDWDFDNSGVVRLDNGWEQKPNDKDEGRIQKTDLNKNIVVHRFLIKTDPKFKMLAININYMGFFGDISINGRNITKCTTKTLDGQYGFCTNMGSTFAFFATNQPIQELVIQTSKNHAYEPGMIQGIYIGSETTIFNFCLRKAIFHYTSLILILLFGCYYVYRYMIQKSDSSLLYFGISNIALGIVYAISNTRIYNILFLYLSYLSIFKISVIIMNVYMVFIWLFIWKRNNQILSDWNLKIFVGCNLATTILVCVSNTNFIFFAGQIFRFVNLSISMLISIQTLVVIRYKLYKDMEFRETFLIFIASIISCIQYVSYSLYLHFRIIEIMLSSALFLYIMAMGAILLLSLQTKKEQSNQSLIEENTFITKNNLGRMQTEEQMELIFAVMCYIQPYLQLLDKSFGEKWIDKNLGFRFENKKPPKLLFKRDKAYQILIADQDAITITLVKNLLPNNYEFIISNSRKDILEILTYSNQIELVLLGEKIDGLSSYEVCKSIRQKYGLYELPVLVMVKRLELDEIEEGLLAGVNDFVFQPLHAGILQARLENMLQLKESIQSERKMETVYLQNQIKPHFLFNALSVIISLCYSDSEKAGDLLEEFSNYLYITFTNDLMVSMISLEKELSLVSSYIKIEKARYGDRLQVEYDIASKLMDVKIPVLLIQPLVENAIRHGIMKRLTGGIIKISVGKEQDKLHITVQDNGVGIKKNVLDELNEGHFIKGIGLKNIQKRLMNEYNEGLSIKSYENEGTTISLKIPTE